MPKHVDPPRFIRLPQVIEMTTLAKPTIYKYMAKGTFPKQIQIGGKSVVWNERDVIDWMNSRSQQRPEAGNTIYITKGIPTPMES